MAGKQPRLEVFQTSPDGLPAPDDLRYLLTAEQAELSGKYQRIDSSIVTLRGIRRQFPVANELIDLGWSEVCYRARVESYDGAAIKRFVWGWSANGQAEPLDARLPEDVNRVVQEAEELANQQVGLTSSLAVYRHQPYGAHEVAAHANFGEERKIYISTSPPEAEDVMDRAIEHSQQDGRNAIAKKADTIILASNKLSENNWSSIRALQDALDGRFIEELQHHQID